MSYQRERDLFIATVTREGLPLWIAERLLREATGFQRRAELACSSEAANRDRVPCPKTLVNGKQRLPTVDGIAPCLCDSAEDHNTGMASGRNPTIPRISLQDWHAKQRCKKLLASIVVGADAPHTLKHQHTANTCPGRPCSTGCDHKEFAPVSWQFLTAGDPRGYTLRLIPPSYAQRNVGRDPHHVDSIGVPARASRLTFAQR